MVDSETHLQLLINIHDLTRWLLKEIKNSLTMNRFCAYCLRYTVSFKFKFLTNMMYLNNYHSGCLLYQKSHFDSLLQTAALIMDCIIVSLKHTFRQVNSFG